MRAEGWVASEGDSGGGVAKVRGRGGQWTAVRHCDTAKGVEAAVSVKSTVLDGVRVISQMAPGFEFTLKPAVQPRCHDTEICRLNCIRE